MTRIKMISRRSRGGWTALLAASSLLAAGVPARAQVSTPSAWAGGRMSVTGAWAWTATCAEGATSGTFEIGQVAADGSYGGTFRNGLGTLQGRVDGNTVEFARVLPELQQRWIGAVVASGMEGTIERPTEVKANCTFAARRGE